MCIGSGLKYHSALAFAGFSWLRAPTSPESNASRVSTWNCLSVHPVLTLSPLDHFLLPFILFPWALLLKVMAKKLEKGMR